MSEKTNEYSDQFLGILNKRRHKKKMLMTMENHCGNFTFSNDVKSPFIR